MLRLRFSAAAEKDYEDIWRYTLQTWGYGQADIYIRQIDNAIQLLLENPLMGVARPDVKEGYRALPVGKHLIFYSTSADVVDILGIPNAQRDVAKYWSGNGSE